MCAHALALSHPCIRCRCLAAYGDAVSAVKWASRLGREHHDELAQFMLGMGYATEALHLPGISKRDVAQQNASMDISEILHTTAVKQENLVDVVQGIVKFAKEFMDLIDAADAIQ